MPTLPLQYIQCSRRPAVHLLPRMRYTRDYCPGPNQQIKARFSVPQYGQDDSFGMADFIRTGSVSRIDHVNDWVNRVVVQFHEPLHFRPGEQAQAHEVVQGPMVAMPA